MAKVERNVAIGDKFVGKHEDQEFVLEIVEHEEKPAFAVIEPEGFDAEDAKGRIAPGIFRSTSAAAGAVTGSSSINGWSFWRPEGEEPAEPKPRGRRPKAKAEETPEDEEDEDSPFLDDEEDEDDE